MTNKKLKIAVICDNKEQYNSYVKSHKECEQCEYIYVDNITRPMGIMLDGVVDLRELTLNILARLDPHWVFNKSRFGGGFDDKSTNTENS